MFQIKEEGNHRKDQITRWILEGLLVVKMIKRILRIIFAVLFASFLPKISSIIQAFTSSNLQHVFYEDMKRYKFFFKQGELFPL